MTLDASEIEDVVAGTAQQIIEKSRKILFGSGVADHARDLAGALQRLNAGYLVD